MAISNLSFRENLVTRSGMTGLVDLSGATVLGAGVDVISNTPFSAAATVSVNGVFSSMYDNYRVIISAISSANSATSFRLRASGVDAATATTYYNYNSSVIWSGGSSMEANNGSTNWLIRRFHTSIISEKILDIHAPAMVRPTQMEFSGIDFSSYGNVGVGYHTQSNIYDGFTFFPAAGTMTGNVRVYGIRN